MGKAIVFYVSGHGFGHAAREVEIINAFGARREDVRVLIRSTVSPTLLERTLRVPYALRPGVTDTGIVQSSSVSHDDEATIREAVAFNATLADRADADARALAHDDVGLIVCDIPPLGCEVADRLAVPSVAIGNFSWDWIYEFYPALTEAAPWLVPAIRRAYAKADLALELPFSCGFGAFRHVRPVPLVARRSAAGRDETRARLGLPMDRRVALLSFGGYGLPSLDLAALDCLDDWTVVTTDRVHALSPDRAPRNILMLAEAAFFASGLRYEDLVSAADVVVTKPGYGIIAECIACGPAMLYTSRGHFREYDVLVREMPRFLRCRFIAQPDLAAGRCREALDALIAQPPPPEILATDGADVVARILSEMMTG